MAQLKCVQCDTALGPPRTGKGRQQELCAACFKENRLKNNRLQDKRRRAERKGDSN